jgi:hypothetical protein
MYVYATILYRLNFKKFENCKKIIGRAKAYGYLHKKYKKFLKEIPMYKSTSKYSDYIWWCWLQGEENAPDLNKACLNSIRRNLKDKKIVIITENNYSNYIEFPDYIIKKYKKGIITKTHFSDLLRTALLVKYGGTWIDSSVLVTGYDKNFFEKNLFVFKNWMSGDDSIVASSWFISAEVNNPILLTTQKLLYKYWKDYNFLLHYFTFHFFFKMACDKYSADFEKVDKYSNSVNHILQFELLEEYSERRYNQILSMTTIHKLSQKIDFTRSNRKTFYNHIIEEYKK